MIYLCSTYSINEYGLNKKELTKLMHRRWEYVRDVVAGLLEDGYPVFSPILHSHPAAVANDMPKDWKFWEELDYQYMDASSEVWVLKMPGWENSVGISSEIVYAIKNGIPVKYIDVENYEDYDI